MKTNSDTVRTLYLGLDVHKEQTVISMAFKGFKLVAGMVNVSEIGTISRFEHPKKLMAFLGLVPCENSSCKICKRGGISKCGNPHARCLLVEQASHYRVTTKISPQLLSV